MWSASVMVTSSPPDTGLTVLIVFVTVDDPPTPTWLAYTHFSPTATGNRVEPADVVEPLDELELLDCVPPEPEPEPPDPPELPEPPPHPATSSAATARAP